MYTVKYLDESLLDLAAIAEFIGGTLNNPRYARKIINLIRGDIRELKRSPERCVAYPFKTENPNFPSPDIYTYRKLVVGNYIIFYVVDHKKKKILVVSIIDGRSDYQNKM